MELTQENMQILYTGYNAAYREGLTTMEAMDQRMNIALETTSMSAETLYPWLEKIPGMRRWIGERVVHQLRRAGVRLQNLDYEDTIEVNVNDIEDDQYGTYMPLFSALGNAVAKHPEEEVWGMLKNGFDATSGLAYDGQYFFDTDHPVLDADGSMTTVSNSGGGAGTAWFLVDDRMTIMPMIFQRRKRADDIVRRDRPTDDPVFDRNYAQYGVHCRDVAGWGLWQLAYGSRQPLTAANYNAARTAMTGMKGDHGRPLGLMPTKLIVPPSLEGSGREVLKAERNAAGATNVWMDSAELVMTPWLA